MPGLVGTILTMTMLIFTALSVTREIERGTMENLLSMPITPFEIMLGKIIPYVFIGFLQAAIIIGFRRSAVWRSDRRQSGRAGGAEYAVHRNQSCRLATRFRRWRKTSCRPCRCRSFSFCRISCCPASCFPSPACRLGAVDRRGAAADAFLRIVRAVMLKGSSLADLRYDALALFALMLVAMTIAVCASAARSINRR